MAGIGIIRSLRARLREWLAASISNRVTFAALSLAMVVALVTGISSFGAVAYLIRHSINADLHTQARLTLQKLQGDLDTLSGEFTTLATNSFIANGLVDSLGRDTYLLPFLEEHKSTLHCRTAIVLCDFRGRPIASNRPVTELPAAAFNDLHDVINTATPRTKLLKQGRSSLLVMVQPVIFPPTGQAEGALVETVDLQELFDAEMAHMDQEYFVQLLSGGAAVARQARGLGDDEVIVVEHRLALARPLNNLALTFQIGVAKSAASRPLELLALVYFLFGLLLLALVINFAHTTARRLTMPLTSLSTTASRIAESGSLTLLSDVSGRDEVGTLAKVFNEMLKRVRASHEELEFQVEKRTRELKEAHDLLENRVELRTAELTEANLRLAREMETTTQLEQQLRQVQKMEAIGTLAGGIAHDFNNILTVIGSYSALTAMQMADGDPLKKNLDHVVTATEKAANLTRSLLAFSRKQVMTPEDTDLNAIVRSVEKFLMRVIGEDIRLTTALFGEALPVHVDIGQIEQVLMNLAANARDAMPRGGVMSIATSLKTLDQDRLAAFGCARPPGSYAVMTVSDSGCGMDEETMGKIFEPFYTTKEVGKGTGLGLAMAYGIIKQHSGHINVYSEPGVGTTFRIYLPALPVLLEAEGDAPAAPLRGARGSETILVAEDDAEIRGVVEKILTESGYQVILAVDGQELWRSSPREEKRCTSYLWT